MRAKLAIFSLFSPLPLSFFLTPALKILSRISQTESWKFLPRDICLQPFTCTCISLTWNQASFPGSLRPISCIKRKVPSAFWEALSLWGLQPCCLLGSVRRVLQRTASHPATIHTNAHSKRYLAALFSHCWH